MHVLKRFSNQTFSSFNIPNFKLYFTGQVISTSGTWMQNVAQGLLVLKLTGSGTALGFLVALQFLPLLLFGTYGGVLADRFSKRKIFLITQSIMCVIALLHAAFVFFNFTQVWMIYILALAMGLITAIENPTKHTFIFEMVGKDQIKNAVALNSVMVNLARVIGPAITGILVPVAGLSICFLINAFSYIAVLIVLMKINVRELHTAEKLTKIKGQLVKGLRYVNNNPSLKHILLMMLIIGTFTYEFPVILPLFAEFTFQNPSTGYAILMTAMGVGAVIGGLFSASRKKTSMRTLILIAFLFGITMLILSLAPSIWIAAVIMIIVGFFSINFNTLTNAMLQLRSAPEMRGRVMSLWSIAFLGTTPIGGPIIGWIGEHYGSRWGIAAGGIAAVIAAIVVYFFVKKDKQHTISPKITLERSIAERNVDLR